jgi:hypothetical protein
VVELAGHAVEEVPLGGCMPVSVLVAAPAVVGLGTGRAVHRRKQRVVLHPPPGDGRLLAERSGHGRGAGIGLQAAGIGERVCQFNG